MNKVLGFCCFQARRALRALRGLVRLKSLVEGATVKRQTTNTLRSMQGISRVQSQINNRRIRMTEENQALQRQLLQERAKELESLQVSIIFPIFSKNMPCVNDIRSALRTLKIVIFFILDFANLLGSISLLWHPFYINVITYGSHVMRHTLVPHHHVLLWSSCYS